MNSFLKSALILTLAAFLGELIEFLTNMVLARELGKEGMGMYMSVLPIVFLVVTIATIELPISISKFLAEHNQKEHRNMMKHATWFATGIIASVMAVWFLVITFIPFFNHYHPYIGWVVLVFIPIVSYSSILRGYFMGVDNMSAIAVSNFVRKSIQLTLLFLVFRTFHFEDHGTALLVAICALVASEAVVFTYFLITYVMQTNVISRGYRFSYTGKEVRKRLLSVSLPTTGLHLFSASAGAIQPFLIKKSLMLSGMTSSIATGHYGMLAGVAMTIGFFPAFIAHSLLVALIPAVSQAQAAGDRDKLSSLLQQSLRITFLYGIPAILIMNIFAEPITNLFFHSSEAAFYLRALWPCFLLHFFVIPMRAYLIGLGLMKDALYHTIWVHVISFSLIFLLASQREWGVSGVILAMNAETLLLTLLHYFTICKRIGLPILFFMKRPLTKL
ncbi:polysaccharide biosynthesis protein [Priestia filamentosa]|uniref:Multidrug transporter MatE n=1 Tax=Priestia filamentosa TaxID=1402861 RepID=A0A1X7DGY2_9BACI|nr:polysaccharide biosynthesis protein [Priestia filamentosa]AKO93446.1 multidrug transporter MatE [Priestia filamentosa]MDT3763637.1 polysaccharide biosynthesis protein [Priestia filamentosa]OXS71869.1 multidrug transporter MatE [Priestia filamentosa]RJS63250.1 polysaccharide biosynthesis protein [Priestia filamentosa]WCM14286.1 polysaccharide biosynthesis protein [Priestia filamentosa]